MKKRVVQFALCCLIGSLAYGQTKVEKTKKSINASKDVTIDLNTNYVEIEIDTWNQNTVEVEAYIESTKLSKDELQKALKSWGLEISGSGDYVSINSKGGLAGGLFSEGDYANELRDLEIRLADLPDIPNIPNLPEMNFAITEMPNMSEFPEMPELPELPEGVSSVQFDYDRYKKEGDTYLEKWSSEYEAKYGKEYKEKMKKWAKEFEASGFQEKMEKWGEEFGKKFEGKWSKEMEAWGKKFGEQFGKDFEKNMENWGKEFEKSFGKDFEKRMEAWGENLAKSLEARSEAMEKREESLAKRLESMEERQEALAERNEARRSALNNRALFRSRGTNSDVKKVIKIKMPKKAKLKLNVRHGELKMSSVIYNAKGDISHSKVLAQHIDGSSTSINASYSQVLIDEWNKGSLNLKYVDDAVLNKVSGLSLTSKSSNINIDYLSGNNMINGSFGELAIHNIMDDFNNLNVVLENSDAWLKLPKTDYSLMYSGERSKLNDKLMTKKVVNSDSGKSIIINAKFSNVTIE
ncbi:hypothetical protein Q2T40_13295 [Winogradskyella maritima]|uniref:Adhesin domain-containing protein n=1 Tax=Winogradskyella maritima TaxID=1517766 RepID=A0ABV8AH15_9FLAO|nr:hypothetical protein [Winogradskyella maritima]